MKSPRNKEFKFPVGYKDFHKKQLFNFQLNRPYAFGYGRFNDLKEAGNNINTFADWKKEMVKQAQKAMVEERWVNAAYYFRAAEFYIRHTDPEKEALYNQFTRLFYQFVIRPDTERHKIPFEDGFLPALRIPAANADKGTLIIHGGFDSFIEEFYSMMIYFSNQGYEVIGFEGPGQGAALRNYGLPITYKWEKPVKAILDYFQLREVTLLGLSMGGWLSLRASAFEPRIKRVITSGHAMDYMKSMSPLLRKIHLWCIGHCRDFMNRMATLKFERKEGMASWMVDHLKFITHKDKPLDALSFYLELNEENLHPEQIKQDVLILSGRKDHFIPLKMHQMQIKALVNANSVSDRVFTEADEAQNHCQVGNINLALKTMIDWMDKKATDSPQFNDIVQEKGKSFPIPKV